MPETNNTSQAPLHFTKNEIELLGLTADAMSAWMGKPVLAEIMDANETGFEWVIFAIPLLPGQSTENIVPVHIGGPNTRIVGNKGGLKIDPLEQYTCEFLWAIQLSDITGVRFIKVSSEGEEIAWSNNLREMLPFDVTDSEENSPQ